MVANALFATAVICLTLALYFMQECQFLIPYRSLLLEKYGCEIAVFASVFFLNLFAAIHAFTRRVFLRDTGKKLAHLEKQLRTGPSILEELSQRLKE